MKWIIGIIAFFILIFLIFNSSSNSSTSSNDSSAMTTVNSNDSPNKNIESNQTEEDVSDPPEFNGYPCTVDCSGHEAGYEWAADKGISDPSDCGGNSDSFIEGCEAYANEQ